MSRTLTSIPDELKDKAELTDKSPKEVMKMVSDQGWRRAYVDGGKNDFSR